MEDSVNAGAQCTSASCSYLDYNTSNTYETIAKYMPATRFYAMIVRDPVDRAWSHYQHFASKCPGEDLSTAECFDKKVRGQVKWLKECFSVNGQLSPYCAKAPLHTLSKTSRILSMGLYISFIQEAMLYLPRGSKMCIISMSGMKNNVNDEMGQFESCAGLSPFANYKTLHVNSSTHSIHSKGVGNHVPSECLTLHKNTEAFRTNRRSKRAKKKTMLNETRGFLQSFFTPFNELLAEFSGRSLEELGMKY